MTRPRTYNPAVRIEAYFDDGELFLGTRLDTGAAVAVRLTQNAPSARRPTWAMFKKGFKDPKMKTPVGGVLQFDSLRPVADGGAPALREGRPLFESTWPSLLSKDTDENPVLAARQARLVEIAAKGGNGEKLAYADIAEAATLRTLDRRMPALGTALAEIARARIVPGDVEERSRFVLVQGGEGTGRAGTILPIGEIGADIDARIGLADAATIEAAAVVRVFVGTVAKDSKRRIADYAKFHMPGLTAEGGWPVAGFVRCNIVLGRHRFDSAGADIPEPTAQRFMKACSFAEFPEPALPGAIDLAPPR